MFLYANFGLFGLVYLAGPVASGLRLPQHLRREAIAPLALLAFNLGYGAALSMLEDQVSALFFGAAAGMLWQLHQIARAVRGAIRSNRRARVPWSRRPTRQSARASRGHDDQSDPRVGEQLHAAASAVGADGRARSFQIAVRHRLSDVPVQPGGRRGRLRSLWSAAS